MTQATSIYVLRDPRTQEVRYVGKTVRDLRHRLAMHIRSAQRGARRHSSNWIRSLLNNGIAPEIKEIEVAYENWAAREKYWIAYYRKMSPGRLTNLTDGGDGLAGLKRPEYLRQLISTQSKERWADPAYREKLLEKLRSKELNDRRVVSVAKAMRNPFSKRRHREATRRALNNPEVQAKRRTALSETMRKPEVRAKYLATLERCRTNPEIRARHRAASKRAQGNPQLRAHLSMTSAAAWTPERRKRQSEVAKLVNADRRERQ